MLRNSTSRVIDIVKQQSKHDVSPDPIPHEKDRQNMAQQAGLPLGKFDALVSTANKAYKILKDLGPFYGNEDIIEPTFRISAQPIELPKGNKERLVKFGEDIAAVGRSLRKLPTETLSKLGDDIELKLPPTWRIDSIIDEEGKMKINEIEGIDGAAGLMIGEQLAYGLMPLEQSTAAHLVNVFRSLCEIKEKHTCKIALVWHKDIGMVVPSYKRLSEFVFYLSDSTIIIDPIRDIELKEKNINLAKEYHGVLNDSFITKEEFKGYGISEEKIYSSGYYNSICNKGLFALIFDESLKEFWINNIGQASLDRLQDILIPTKFVETSEELQQMRKEGKVVKLSSAGPNTGLMDSSAGVAIPEGSTKHSEDDRWEVIRNAIGQPGVRVIAQDYIRPQKVQTFLRKKATNLERVNWYNRVCVKYVCDNDPNKFEVKPAITAIEVTLGPDVVPAGRANCFTAGYFSE